jgi:EAL domain-containing protein (putative c-di-GMP-specific phosphodiesterase class I)
MLRIHRSEAGPVAVLPAQTAIEEWEAHLSSEEHALVQQVREAVEHRSFHLHYQPLFSVSDRTVVGVEALLRWDGPTGRIPPSRFVPFLESTGLIATVGEEVLAEACREVAGWPHSAGSGFLTVNVSAYQLVPGFADLVVGILAETGFPSHRLCLELTNPARIANPAAAWVELRRLKGCDIRLFIDDFGTAGASIVDLKQFVIDAVKIDGSFVKGLGEQEDDDAIVTALIGLAHALGMNAIAENVETEEQLERLQDLGCDLAQGFYLGSPGTGPQVRNLFAAD